MSSKNAAGGNNWRRLDVHPVVFWTSAFLIIGAVIATAITMQSGAETMVDGEPVPVLKYFFNTLQGGIAKEFGWFFVLSVNVFLGTVIYLMFSKVGSLKLGKPNEKPEFGYGSWIAMLFSAGMGIGLLFYSVAEPIMHFSSPPGGIEGGNADAAQRAMATTMFHWGFHAWGIYALVGLALAFFSFRKGLPLTIRSAFQPLLGDKIHGRIGDLIDILAVVATLFGVATSLGLGAQQIFAGLQAVFGFETSGSTEKWIEVALIAAITGAATTSVVLGLDAGIRRLSVFTMFAGAALLILIFLLGPTSFILNALVQNVGVYAQNFIWLSTWNEAYAGTHWQDGWTVFYWAWWIAWSPFVGMFIARVSRGRTVKEFAQAVLIVPTLLTMVWLTVFGSTALHGELNGNTLVSDAVIVQKNVPGALFALFQTLPDWSFMILSLLAILVIIVFFVTSSDSGSLVIDIITAGGNPDPPVVQRVFWAVLEGLVAATLLLAGGLGALQTAAVTTGLPFTLVLFVMAFSLVKGLKEEHAKRRSRGDGERNRGGRGRGEGSSNRGGQGGDSRSGGNRRGGGERSGRGRGEGNRSRERNEGSPAESKEKPEGARKRRPRRRRSSGEGGGDKAAE